MSKMLNSKIKSRYQPFESFYTNRERLNSSSSSCSSFNRRTAKRFCKYFAFSLIGAIFLFFLISVASSKSLQRAGLYSPEDKVFFLDKDNIKKNIFNSNRAWLVEFYSSWCGHCINFAPLWKTFANETWGWRNLVSIAGLDCANEDNIETCREFEVLGYPSIRFFPPKTAEIKERDKDGKDVLNTGDKYEKTGIVGVMKRSLISKLQNYTGKLLSASDDSFTNVDEELFQENSSIWTSNPYVSTIIILYESDSSYVGKELILRLNQHREVLILRFIKKNSLYDQVKLEGWPAAAIVKKGSSPRSLFFSSNENLVESLYKAIFQQANLKPDPGFNGGLELEVQMPEPNKTHLKMPVEDINYMEDLIHAVRNSLKNEVLLVKTIFGPKLEALKNYLFALSEFFPADRKEMSLFLKRLAEWTNGQFEIKASKFLERMIMLENEFKPYDIDYTQWMGCKGSQEGLRGYPCSLWKLFHTLTIMGYIREKDAKVIRAIKGYVGEFFGCRECADHFVGMADTDNAANIISIKDQMLWLWSVHNNVNARLKGGLSEDPEFPKEQFPTIQNCESCRKVEEKEQFNEAEVINYLVKVYAKPIRGQKSNSGESNKSSGILPSSAGGFLVKEKNQSNMHEEQFSIKSNSGFFSTADIWILLIVYFSVVLLLLLGYIHFRSRRLDRTTILCKKEKMYNSSDSLHAGFG